MGAASHNVEYVAGDPESLDDPGFAEFRRVFGHYMVPEELCGPKETDERAKEEKKALAKAEKAAAGDADPAAEEDGTKAISKKKRKLENRMSISQLKQLVKRPDA